MAHASLLEKPRTSGSADGRPLDDVLLPAADRYLDDVKLAAITSAAANVAITAAGVSEVGPGSLLTNRVVRHELLDAFAELMFDTATGGTVSVEPIHHDQEQQPAVPAGLEMIGTVQDINGLLETGLNRYPPPELSARVNAGPHQQ